MTFLKNYTYTWWQIGIFKLALLSIGAAIGIHFHAALLEHLIVILIVGVVCALYTMSVSFRQL